MEQSPQKNEITGHISNFSPVQNSNKTNYFDMVIQTESRLVRGVCFSSARHGESSALFKNSSPVKISNITVKDVETDYPMVLMNARTKLHKTEVSFKIQQCTYDLNIGFLSTVNNKQLITIKAKVVNLSGVKKMQTQRYDPKNKTDAILVDPSGSVRIILWEQFATEVEEQKTYTFSNVRVRKDPHLHEVSLNTPLKGCLIELCDDFQETLAKPQQLPESYTSSTVTGQIIGVNNFNVYYSCVGCSKKATPDQSPCTYQMPQLQHEAKTVKL